MLHEVLVKIHTLYLLDLIHLRFSQILLIPNVNSIKVLKIKCTRSNIAQNNIEILTIQTKLRLI